MPPNDLLIVLANDLAYIRDHLLSIDPRVRFSHKSKSNSAY
jgi:hypothetical protein